MLNTTNILKLILNLDKPESICFLCLKSQNKVISIYTDVEVIGNCFNLSLTLANITKEVFPCHEILFNQACEDCSNLLIKIFITLNKYKNNIMVLKYIINIFDKQIPDTNLADIGKVFIRMNIPEFNDIMRQKSKLSANSNKKTFQCNKCEMKFKTNDLLQEHKKNLHKNTNEATICDVCGETFKSPNSLKAHINCHKKKECPYCLKVLKSHSHFNIHLKSHKSGVKRKRNRLYYNCSNCDYHTLNKKTLEAHMNKMHLQIRPYVCQTCYKGFYKKSNLTEHISTHSETKNKTCDICGDHFVNDKTLIEHQRLHSDSRPYECNICNKKFVTSGRRSDHIKRSHMEKTECCIFCDRKYSLKKELNRHVKKVHSEYPLTITNNFDVNISNYKFDDPMVLPIT